MIDITEHITKHGIFFNWFDIQISNDELHKKCLSRRKN